MLPWWPVSIYDARLILHHLKELCVELNAIGGRFTASKSGSYYNDRLLMRQVASRVVCHAIHL